MKLNVLKNTSLNLSVIGLGTELFSRSYGSTYSEKKVTDRSPGNKADKLYARAACSLLGPNLTESAIFNL